MTCSFSKETIEETVEFHGHSCPGLAIGIRVAEYVKKEFSDPSPAAIVCVAETDMCGIDAIQYLTGCTYGKGNLIHQDYGKTAFSFYERDKSRGVRLLLKPESRGEYYGKITEMMAQKSSGSLSEEEQQKLTALRLMMEERFMALPLEEMFSVEELKSRPPRPARILQSLGCESCGEQTMESRTRRFAGKTLCIPCYRKVEQKI